MEFTTTEINMLLAGQHTYFQSQATKDYHFRLTQLTKLQKAIQQYQPQLLEALAQDLGRHPFESYTAEIGFVLTNIRHAKRQLKNWMTPTKVKTPLMLFPYQSQIRPEPLGSVLIIGPFNYPFQLLIEPLIGAIAAGNCAVIKPSEIAPFTAAVITEMLVTTFSPEYIAVINGGISTTTALLANNFDHIFFTGSTKVGQIVMEAAAKNLTPVTLELGGKSPAIVTAHADIKRAAQRVVYGKFLNVGQTCVAPDYVLVAEPIKAEFISACQQVINQFYGPDPATSSSYGRIVNNQHFMRLTALLAAESNHVLSGGQTNAATRYIEPTLIDATWDSASMQDEIFGPLLPIIGFTDLTASINNINERPKPLALYIFSDNPAEQAAIIDQTSSGSTGINIALLQLASPNLPFGGVGAAGIGSYHGYYSFMTFSHMRSILKANKFTTPFIFPPYTERNLRWIKRLMR